MSNTAIVLKHVTRMSTPDSYPQVVINETTVSTKEQATANQAPGPASHDQEMIWYTQPLRPT